MSVNNIPPNSGNILPEIPDLSFIESVTKKDRVRNKASVKKVAHGMAEIAYSMGMTNDIDEFLDDMSEDILDAWDEMDEDKKKKRKKYN